MLTPRCGDWLRSTTLMTVKKSVWVESNAQGRSIFTFTQ